MQEHERIIYASTKIFSPRSHVQTMKLHISLQHLASCEIAFNTTIQAVSLLFLFMAS